ncbi:MAG: M15 family metallopeptidase [Candidatus Saccharimonas sp.]
MKSGAIPLDAGHVDGWRFMPLDECGESMVAIGNGTKYEDILTSSVYAGEHSSPYRGEYAIEAAEPVVYVRQSVAERLLRAQQLLPDGHKLIVFDAYRSIEVQRALYDQFMNALRVLKSGWNETQLSDETERYVSLPSTNPSCPSPHSTGGAVDVAIIKDGRMIEFGTPFDNGTKRSALRYFEDEANIHTQVDVEARENRRLLYRVMHEAGFEGFEHEWWHFNAVETQMGARTALREKATFSIATSLVPKSTYQHRRKVLSAHEAPYAEVDRIAPTN